MAWVRIGAAAQLPPDSMIEARVTGKEYAVCNVAGSLHAISGICPHRGGPLGQGALNGFHVTCPWHAWEFDCRTGAYELDPAKRLATYEVKVEGPDLLLNVP
jgi:nitrite reductase (NADH) small subunit